MARKSYFVPGIIIGKLLLFFLILYFNLGMYGFDSYIHLQYIDSILENGHIVALSFGESYIDFIGFHVFASGISSLTGIEAGLIYEFVSIIIPILIFDLTIVAFIRHIDKKRKGYVSNDLNLKYLALILLFPAILGIQMLLGRPNSLGISLFSLCLYLYLCKPDKFRAQITAGFIAVVTLKIHHLSAIFLLPVIFFSSIFLAKNYKSILSLVYAIPAVLIVQTIKTSREFGIVNQYLQNASPAYETIYNIFIGREYVFLIMWLAITLLGFFIRKRYGKVISDFFTTQRIVKLSSIALMAIIVVLEIAGLFVYSTTLNSWFITLELVIILILSGIALIFNNTVRMALFSLGFFFYGLTVVLSLMFSSEHELSWVAPRTFIFTVLFISILAYIAISDILPKLKAKWKPLFISALIVNSYFSFAYMGNQYLPGYNLTNTYQDITLAHSITSSINLTIITSNTISVPFSISKHINGFNIYNRNAQVFLDANSTIQANGYLLARSNYRYIVLGTVMDLWLGLPLRFSTQDLTYLLNVLYYSWPTQHVVISNNYNYLIYHL